MPRFIDHHRLTPLHAVRSTRSRPRGATRPDGASCQDERATRDPQCSAPRHGFTLVEMLVATALTLIILLIFAQVFRAATRTIGVQRGIGQNDARARMLNTVLRNDLQKATFRDHPDSTSRGLLTLGIYDDNTEDISFRPIHKNQAGFWYISENNPDNDTDDVLHFTVGVDKLERNKESHPYVGKAAKIGRPFDASSGVGTFNPDYGIGRFDGNQPEFDDGDSPIAPVVPANSIQNTNSNGASQSRFAEVCYFLRNGTLFRRVMLLRDPLMVPDQQNHDQPEYYEVAPPLGPGWRDLIQADYDGNSDMDANSTPGSQDFWHDFDFCAYHSGTEVNFLGKQFLSNASTTVGDRLAHPHNRFGFQYRLDFDPNYGGGGRPVEYADGGTTFIGRLTHQETSHPGVTWPGRFNAATNPWMQGDLTVVNGVVRDVSRNLTFDGPRRGEDIVLTNVDAFDIKLFEPDTTTLDDGGAFVDIGHGGTGHLSSAQGRNAAYGPRVPSLTVANNVFDTWHSDNITYGRAPYRPLYDDPINTAPPAGRTTWAWEVSTPYIIRDLVLRTPGSRIYPFALPDSAYATAPDVGPDGLPGNAGVDDDGVGGVDDRGELGWAGSDDVADVQNDCLYYEAVDLALGATGLSDPVAPSSPFLKKFGHRVIDNGILWQCYDNRVGIPLIQITVRYRDPGSNLSRQLTIQHSLTDRSE